MLDIGKLRKFMAVTSDGADHANDAILSDLLRRVREMLRMDVVFVSEFSSGRRVFRAVESAPGENDVLAGGSDPLEESYCQRVVDGRIPMAIPDAMALDVTNAMPATRAVNVRAHLSVPVVLRSGRVFGTLCCFSHTPRETLGDADVQALRAVADYVAAGIDRNGVFRSKVWPQ